MGMFELGVINAERPRKYSIAGCRRRRGGAGGFACAPTAREEFLAAAEVVPGVIPPISVIESVVKPLVEASVAIDEGAALPVSRDPMSAPVFTYPISVYEEVVGSGSRRHEVVRRRC